MDWNQSTKYFVYHWPDAEAMKLEFWARARIGPFCTPNDPINTRFSGFSPRLSQTLRWWSMPPRQQQLSSFGLHHMRQSMDTGRVLTGPNLLSYSTKHFGMSSATALKLFYTVVKLNIIPFVMVYEEGVWEREPWVYL